MAIKQLKPLKTIQSAGLAILMLASGVGIASTVQPPAKASETQTAQGIDTQVVDPSLDGVWDLQWEAGGIDHYGRLYLSGDRGTLLVKADLPRDTILVEEDIQLRTREGAYILDAANATYPGTDTPHDSYSPDEFEVKLSSRNDILRMQNCPGSNCFPVDVREVR